MMQPQHGRPGALGDHHGFTRLTTTLAALEAGQRTQEARDTAIRAQLTIQAQELARLRAGSHRLVLALGGAVGWQLTHPPEQGYARALGALDATLAQQWGSLPKPVQESLTRTYGRSGWTSPGDRQGARQ